MSIIDQKQEYDGRVYRVIDLIHASKDLVPFELDAETINRHYFAPCSNDFDDFVSHCRGSLDADLSYPIILSPTNVILDGKHRLAKCLIQGIAKIKAVKLKEMPYGELIND